MPFGSCPLLALWRWARDLILVTSIGEIRTVLSAGQEHPKHEENNVGKACSRAEAHSGPLNNTSFLAGSVGESQSSNVKERP